MVQEIMQNIKLIPKNFFRVARLSLGFLGYWPEQNINVILILKVVINLIILAWMGIGEVSYGFVNLDKLIFALDAFCPAITKVITVCKLFLIFFYRKELTAIFNRLGKIWWKEENYEKINFMTKSELTANICTLLLFSFGNFTGFSYTMRPVVTYFLNKHNGQNSTWELPFKIVLPYDGESTPGYEITYFLLTYSCIVTVFGFAGCDGIFFSFCFYISNLFKGIQVDIDELIKGKQKKFSEAENRIIFKRIQQIIRDHNIIIELCENFVSLYTIIILMHFVSAAIVICMSSIDLILSTGFSSLLYVNYNMAALTQLFVYCAGGNFVSDTSREIAETIYFSEWYKCDKRLQKTLLLMMMRAQKGTEIIVPFFAPSLPVFGTILSTAGSYITLLKTFL